MLKTKFPGRSIRWALTTAFASLLVASPRAPAATLTWTGLALDDLIGSAGNWSAPVTPLTNDFLIFGGSTRLAPQLATDLAVGSLSFNNTAGAFTLGGLGVYTVGAGGMSNNSVNLQTITNGMILGAAQSWNAAAGALSLSGPVNNGGFLLTLNGAKATSLSGPVSGAGGLTKTGAGTLTLTGANSFSGPTTLSAGFVAIGSNTAFGSSAVRFGGAKIQSTGGSWSLGNAITAAANTTFDAAGDLTFTNSVSLTKSRTFTVSGAGTISFEGEVKQSGGGNLKVNKTGSGTLALTGLNTFKGGLTLTAGTLVLGHDEATGPGRFSLGSGTLQATATRTLDNLINLTGNTVFAGAHPFIFTNGAAMTASRTLSINNPGVTFDGILSGASFSLTKDGAGTLTLGGTATNTYSGGTVVNDGKLALAKTGSANALIGTVLTIGNSVGAANSAIVQLQGSNQILDTLNLALQPDGQLDLQSFSETIGGLTATGGSIIGTGRLDLGGDVTTTASGTNQTSISANLGLNGSRTFTINDNSVAGDSDLAVSGLISGAANRLTKAGLGTLALSGANTYSGGTDLNHGTILLGRSSVGAITSGPLGTATVNLGDLAGTNSASLLFGTTAGLTVANPMTVRAGSSGNTLALGGLNPTGLNTFSGNVALARNVDLTAATGGEVAFNGVLSGVGFGITKTGGGTIRLGNTNSFTGLTTVSAGTLAYGISNALASGAITVAGGTLDFGSNRSDTVGTVILEAGSIIGSGTSSLTSTAAFSLRNGSVSVILAGSVGLNKSTTGTVTLSGLNAYTGTTEISAGTLQQAVANTVPSGSAVAITAGAVFDLASWNASIGSLAGAGTVSLGSALLQAGGDNSNTTFSGIIGGLGGFEKAGSGILILSGANTFTGATAITGGTLRLGAANVLADTSALSVSASRSFDLNNFHETIGSLAGAGHVLLGSGTLTTGGSHATTLYSGAISGTGSVIKAGLGIFSLAGVNSFNGAVTLSGGSLAFSGATGSAPNAAAVTLNSGTTLTLDNSVVSGGENSNRLSDSVPIYLGGATMRFISDSDGSNETVGALHALSGASAIDVVHNGSATDRSALTFSALGTIAPGATINFSGTGGTLGFDSTGPHIYILGQANGFIGGWATVGSSFAEYFATDGVRAFSDFYAGALGININDPTKIVLLTAASLAPAYTLTNPGTTSNLGLSVTDAALVDLGSLTTNTLNLVSGGLIKSTASTTTISGTAGRLTAGATAPGTLSITVNSGSTLSIGAKIINNAGPNGLYGDGDDGVVSLSKSDAGLLILSGANTYTGTNFFNGGLTEISGENNLGDPTSDVSFGNGTLRLTTGFTASPGKLFSIRADLTGTLDIVSGQTLTLGSVNNVLTTGNAASVLQKTGSGLLVIQSANPGFDGTLRISAGAVELREAQALGDATNRGRVSLSGGILNLRGDSHTSFANEISFEGDATVDVGRLSGTTPAVTHSMGALSIGAKTMTVTGSNGAALQFGPVTLTGAAIFNPSSAVTSLGAITGPFGFAKIGAENLVLNGVGTYTGPTSVEVGTLLLSAANGVAPLSALTVASGASFNLNGFANTIGSLAGAGSVALGTATLTSGDDHSSTTYSGQISGTGSLSKRGTGTLTLSGTSSFTGPTWINGGTLQFGIADALSPQSAVAVATGATFALNNLHQTIGSLAGTGTVALGSGTLTSGANHTSTTFAGTMSGSGAFTKIGTGTLILSGTSTHTGATNISGGVLLLQNTAALGTTLGATVVHSGGELQLASGVAGGSEPLSLSGTGATGSGALRLLSGTASWAGPITTTAASTIGVDSGLLTLTGTMNTGGGTLSFAGAGSSRVEGVLSGSGGIAKAGAGTLFLSAPNSFSGTALLTDGTLNLQHNGALGATGATNGTVVTTGAAIVLDSASGINLGGESLTLNGSGAAGAGALQSLLGGNAWGGNILLGSDTTISVSAGSLNLSGAISQSGGARALTKTGTGLLILDGDNSYSGPTLISAGTLQLGSDERIGNASAVLISAGATFDLNEATETIGSLAGSATATVDLGLSGGNSLTTGGDHTTATFAGTLTGTGDLVKTGSGTMTLTGTNSYVGATTVAGGTLAVTSQLTATTGLTVESGGTLLLGTISAINSVAPVELAGGTLQIANGLGANTSAITENLGQLILSATSTIDFGTSVAGGVKLLLAGILQTPGAHLHIVNWTGTPSLTGTNATDRLLFSGSASSFTFAQSEVSFNGATGYTLLSVSGGYEVVAVPEPSAWLTGLALLGLIGYRERRRFLHRSAPQG